jgi:hypothetical protein
MYNKLEVKMIKGSVFLSENTFLTHFLLEGEMDDDTASKSPSTKPKNKNNNPKVDNNTSKDNDSDPSIDDISNDSSMDDMLNDNSLDDTSDNNSSNNTSNDSSTNDTSDDSSSDDTTSNDSSLNDTSGDDEDTATDLSDKPVKVSKGVFLMNNTADKEFIFDKLVNLYNSYNILINHAELVETKFSSVKIAGTSTTISVLVNSLKVYASLLKEFNFNVNKYNDDIKHIYAIYKLYFNTLKDARLILSVFIKEIDNIDDDSKK